MTTRLFTVTLGHKLTPFEMLRKSLGMPLFDDDAIKMLFDPDTTAGASIKEIQDALDIQIKWPSRSFTWLVYTLISPDYAYMDSDDRDLHETEIQFVSTKWPDMTFDYIQVREIQLIQCRDHVLEEAYRCLNPGGQIDYIQLSFQPKTNNNWSEWANERAKLSASRSIMETAGFVHIGHQSFPLHLNALYTEGLLAAVSSRRNCHVKAWCLRP